MKIILIIISILLFSCCGRKIESKVFITPKIIVRKRIVTYQEIFQSLDSSRTGLTEKSFMYAYNGYLRLKKCKLLHNDNYLTICDFSKPTNTPRLFVINIKKRRVEVHTWVSHGSRSGDVFAKSFSNRINSHKSSLGFYITSMNTYSGKSGTSLRIRGLEYTNSNAYERAVVVHGSYYTGPGKVGHSLGCVAVPMRISKALVSYIKGGSCLFIYYPSTEYLKKSKII
jgi:hypothetical protein